jgi:hypothetical protein
MKNKFIFFIDAKTIKKYKIVAHIKINGVTHYGIKNLKIITNEF